MSGYRVRVMSAEEVRFRLTILGMVLSSILLIAGSAFFGQGIWRVNHWIVVDAEWQSAQTWVSTRNATKMNRNRYIFKLPNGTQGFYETSNWTEETIPKTLRLRYPVNDPNQVEMAVRATETIWIGSVLLALGALFFVPSALFCFLLRPARSGPKKEASNPFA